MPSFDWGQFGQELGGEFASALGAELFGGGSPKNPRTRFTPWGVNTGAFSTSWNPRTRTASVGMSPQLAGINSQLFGLASSNYGYAANTDPYAIAQEYYNRMQASMAPTRAAQLAELRGNLFNTGRIGLGLGEYGANPEFAAFYLAQQQADQALSADAIFRGQDLLNQYQQRGDSATQGILGINEAGLDAIKLGGLLGTYGDYKGPSGSGFGGTVSPTVSGGAPLSGSGTGGGNGLFGSMPLPGMGSGNSPINRTVPGAGFGEAGPGFSVNAEGTPTLWGPGASGGTDILDSLGFGGDGFIDRFVDGLLPDEAVNFMVDLWGSLWGGDEPPGGMVTGSQTNQGALNIGPNGAYVLTGADALNQMSADQINAIAGLMPPGMGAAFTNAIRSGNIGYAEHLVRAVTRGTSSGGGAGFGWEGLNINRGLDMAQRGQSGGTLVGNIWGRSPVKV